MILPGARLAIDYGDKRIGVAKSDDSRLIASPLITLDNGESTGSAVIAIKELVDVSNVEIIYIGLPLHLSGKESDSSNKARSFAALLKAIYRKKYRCGY